MLGHQKAHSILGQPEPAADPPLGCNPNTCENMNILRNRHRLWLEGNGMRFSSETRVSYPPDWSIIFWTSSEIPPHGTPRGGEESEDQMEDLRFHNLCTGDNDLQLVVKLDLILPEGSTLPGVEILIDTRAEVNLIREGLVPKHLLSPAEKTFRFLTADGTRMRGRDRLSNSR